jgi:serine/threonine-protein kinase
MTDPGSSVISGGYAPGDLIADKYRLEEKLGEGGQATVFRASNLSLDAPVAIKLVHEAEDRAPANRLLREARAAARIGHPAIVRVFDLGETDRGDPFLVMELLSGEDLANLPRGAAR